MKCVGPVFGVDFYGRKQMSELGKWLAIFGMGSFALKYFGMEFRILMWVDVWGPGVGNLIRFAFIGAGAVLFVLGEKAFPDEEDSFDDIQAPAQGSAEAQPAQGA
jgi:hypothetical protein